MNYKETLNLPKTAFPMKANLSEREPTRVEQWDRLQIYRRIIENNAGMPRFIMHDGPPYANGRIHSGTVLNKILKDFIVKFKNMSGFQCEYIPGWDCHGLPIENNVEKEVGKPKDEFDAREFRRLCQEYAMKFVNIQREEFKRLGVLAAWEAPYLTLDPEYEATVVREFGKVVGQGALYKRKKPVLWCSHHSTALAEAEVEYEELSSPSIWVKFPMNESARKLIPSLPPDKPAFVVIWTTTPWTLPANLAITVHPSMQYSVLDCGEEVYLVATELTSNFIAECSLPQPTTLSTMLGREMEGATCRHPFIDRDSVIILGEFVSVDTGTGCVHTAPGHGADDYEVGLRYGLDAYAPVDDKGCFTSDVPEYQGRHVFDCDNDIVEMLRRKGMLLAAKRYTHQYPVCVRCKKPIIFRATSQWFISMDKTGLRKRALSIIPSVEWVPAKGKQRIGSMVETRPDWCLSRQRLWGVPIVAFYCQSCGEPLLSESIINHVASIFSKEGSDAWFTRTVPELLPSGTSCPVCGNRTFDRENDVIDVWFESGVSYAAVIENRYGENTICDLYLEGSDQHRGWFQSSLLESVLTRNRSPFASVLTHGFVVDGEGRKLAKALGNYIPPQEIIDKYGAEIYRLWAASENYQEDVRISDEVLRTLVDSYLKVRNTFRFLLGNLDGFNPSTDLLPPAQMQPVDRYILNKTRRLMERILASYESYRFHDIYQQVIQFCTVDLSAFYLDVLKDRLYVLPKFSVERRSARTALYHILSCLVRALAPILSFTCEEVWEHMPHAVNDPDSVLLARFPQTDLVEFNDPELTDQFNSLLSLRSQVNKQLEAIRTAKIIGHSLDASVTVTIGRKHPYFPAVQAHAAHLKELLIVSECTVVPVDGDCLDVSAVHAPGKKCSRCWNWSLDTDANQNYPSTCGRCSSILAQLQKGE